MPETHPLTPYGMVNWIVSLLSALLLTATGLVVYNVRTALSDIKAHVDRLDVRVSKTEVDVASLREVVRAVDDMAKAVGKIGLIEEKITTIDRRTQMIVDRIMAKDHN